MVDSTNPRVMADNIKKLNAGNQANADAIEENTDAIEALQIFDNSEINTGKVWIDGKKIYRKVFVVESIPNNTTATIEHNITDLGTVITFGGVMPATNGNDGRPIPYANRIVLLYNSTQIKITTDIDYSSRTCFIIFEYTKAEPTPDVSPAPDSRSLEEPEVRDPEAEPDPIEEIKEEK